MYSLCLYYSSYYSLRQVFPRFRRLNDEQASPCPRRAYIPVEGTCKGRSSLESWETGDILVGLVKKDKDKDTFCSGNIPRGGNSSYMRLELGVSLDVPRNIKEARVTQCEENGNDQIRRVTARQGALKEMRGLQRPLLIFVVIFQV